MELEAAGRERDAQCERFDGEGAAPPMRGVAVVCGESGLVVCAEERVDEGETGGDEEPRGERAQVQAERVGGREAGDEGSGDSQREGRGAGQKGGEAAGRASEEHAVMLVQEAVVAGDAGAEESGGDEDEERPQAAQARADVLSVGRERRDQERDDGGVGEAEAREEAPGRRAGRQIQGHGRVAGHRGRDFDGADEAEAPVAPRVDEVRVFVRLSLDRRALRVDHRHALLSARTLLSQRRWWSPLHGAVSRRPSECRAVLPLVSESRCRRSH
mmetsp:Transcript_13822/g.41793  ORF Transcript_13822/g.41793 Transcript_13822/m.41793 type:complete len:272 (-) Transcript_13822:302-1117(-)